MGFDYGYAWQKLYLARHCMMGFSSWEARFADTVPKIKLAMGPKYKPSDVKDVEIREGFETLISMIDMDGLEDPQRIGLLRIKAESMDDVARSEFAQAVDKLATLLDQRRYLKNLLEDTERGVKTGLTD